MVKKNKRMNKTYLLYPNDEYTYDLAELAIPEISEDGLTHTFDMSRYTILASNIDKESIQAILFMLKAVEHHKELENKQFTVA